MSQSEKYEVLKAQEEFYEKIMRGEDPLRKPLPLDEEALKEIKRQLKKLKEEVDPFWRNEAVESV